MAAHIAKVDLILGASRLGNSGEPQEPGSK